MNDDGFIPGIFIGALVAVFCMFIPWSFEVHRLKSKAIETGAAEWLVDQKTGTTTFTWKELK